MGKYEYTGVGFGGKVICGEVEANNKTDARSRVQENNIRLLTIKSKLPVIDWSIGFNTSVKQQDISRFIGSLE